MSSGRAAARDTRYGRRGGGWIEEKPPETSIEPRSKRRATKKVAHVDHRERLSDVTVYALRWVADLLLAGRTVYSACPYVAEQIWFGRPDMFIAFETRLRDFITRWYPGMLVTITASELHQLITDHTHPTEEDSAR